MLHVLLLFVSFLLIEQRRKIMKPLENGEITKLRPSIKNSFHDLQQLTHTHSQQ